MTEPLNGKPLLDFLKDNAHLTRQEQVVNAGYKTLLELVSAIADANKLHPDFWPAENDELVWMGYASFWKM